MADVSNKDLVVDLKIKLPGIGQIYGKNITGYGTRRSTGKMQNI